MNPGLLSRVINDSHFAREHGLYRRRRVNDEAHIKLNFSSNDYLSLSNEPRIKHAYQTGYERYGVGSGGSALVSGYHPIHHQLEQGFAAALQVDDCLFFSSGYTANLSLMALLARLDLRLYID